MRFDGVHINKELVRQTAKYVAWGVTSSAVSYSCYLTLTRLLDLYFFAATIIASILANTFSFFANKRYVFITEQKDECVKKIVRSYFEFLSSRLLSCLLESSILTYFINQLGMYDITVKCVSGIIFGILNFFFTKIIIFEENNEKIIEIRKNNQLRKSAIHSSIRDRWSIRYL